MKQRRPANVWARESAVVYERFEEEERMFHLYRLALVLLTAFPAAPAHARGMGNGSNGASDRQECGGGVRSLSYSPDSTVQWTVSSQGCELNFRAGAVHAAVWGISIISKPKHGTAGVFSRYSIAYKPAVGFAGEDTFSFAVIGRTGTE